MIEDENRTDTDVQFMTGAGPLLTTPLPPELDGLDIEHGRSCGDPSHVATFSLAASGPIVVLDAGQTASFEPESLVGSVSAVSIDHEILLGSSTCAIENFPGGAARNSTTTVRFAALDIAGHFSGWTEEEEFSMAGCNASGASGTALWCLAPFLWLGSRRRRHAGAHGGELSS